MGAVKLTRLTDEWRSEHAKRPQRGQQPLSERDAALAAHPRHQAAGPMRSDDGASPEKRPASPEKRPANPNQRLKSGTAGHVSLREAVERKPVEETTAALKNWEQLFKGKVAEVKQLQEGLRKISEAASGTGASSVPHDWLISHK